MSNSAKGLVNSAKGSINNAKGFTLIEVMVAMSLLALGVAGVAQLRHSAYRHISLTQEIQEASYFADSHFNTLSTENKPILGVQSGEYSRGQEVAAYPWQLNLVALNENSLQPESSSLSNKVTPVRADLSVWVDQGARELRFHSLLLLEPLAVQAPSRLAFKLSAKK